MHLSTEDLRRHGYAAIDRICRYLEEVEEMPVRSSVKPGDIRAQLPSEAPQKSESLEVCLADLDRIIMPGLTHWQSPNFYAFFPCNHSVPSLIGEFLCAGLGAQGMLWEAGPACTELETHVMDWLVGLLDLPEFFLSTSSGGGVIQDTASSATLCAMIAARERATNFAVRQSGVTRRMIAYTSEQAHSSVAKAMIIAGLGEANLRLVPVDDRCAMKADALAQMVADDHAAGHLPFFVCATLGTTAANGMDPLGKIGPICRGGASKHLWLHVDAAMSGTAALCPEFRFIHDGIEFADSYCFNPHKWMFTNFDCDCFWVRDRGALIGALGLLPEYLRNRATESGAVIDYRDWQIPLGRRFRSLKLWFVLRSYGAEGLQEHVREHVRLARHFAERVQSDHRLELLMDPPLNLVCFRVRGATDAEGDARTRALLEALNATNAVYLTHAIVHGRFVIRVSIGATRTQRRHVDALWERICALIAP